MMESVVLSMHYESFTYAQELKALTFCITVVVVIWTALLVLGALRVAAAQPASFKVFSASPFTRVFCCTQKQQVSP